MTNKKVTPYKTTFDYDNAYWMARLSKEIYVPVSKEKNTPDKDKIIASLKTDDDEFKDVVPIEEGNTEAALIEHKEYLCMVFRGTDEPRDWIDNANAFSTEKLFGEFHKGFWDATEEIWPYLYAEYQKKYRETKRPLFITGHSLGGAMATIAAARLIHLDKPFISVYTFGQPRVMKRDTARIFNVECGTRFFRFLNNNDIVPRLPPRFMEYSHVGTFLYISKEGEIHPDPGYWFKLIDKIDGYKEALGKEGIDAFEDHQMDDYYSKLK